jgi:hypothetical protein
VQGWSAEREVEAAMPQEIARTAGAPHQRHESFLGAEESCSTQCTSRQLEHACGVFEYISATITSRIADEESEERVVGDVLMSCSHLLTAPDISLATSGLILLDERARES